MPRDNELLSYLISLLLIQYLMNLINKPRNIYNKKYIYFKNNTTINLKTKKFVTIKLFDKLSMILIFI